MFDRLSRRTLLSGLATLAVTGVATRAFADDASLDMILRDPQAPVGGNPKGDLTIVAFLDYNCPFCKKAEPDLLRLVKSDGRIRLVHKDWPILGDASVFGAQLALEAELQGEAGRSRDFREGVAAFIEKRPARYEGR